VAVKICITSVHLQIMQHADLHFRVLSSVCVVTILMIVAH